MRKPKGEELPLKNYQMAHTFLRIIRDDSRLNLIEKQNLRRQALHGDLDGAERVYDYLARRVGT